MSRMSRTLAAGSLAAAFSFALPLPAARGADAERCDLTLDRALALARERAPVVLAAGARVAEARAVLQGASLPLRTNPDLEVDAGPRFSSDGDTTDARAKLSQALELGGARGARIDGARAALERTAADADETLRRAQRAVTVGFFAARAADERLALAERAADVAAALERAAGKRHRAGDVALLDVNVARATLARARADVAAERARRRLARGDLAALLGLGDAAPAPCGPLDVHARVDLRALLDAAPARADLRALAASVDEAEADRRLGAARAWPGLRIGTEYKREEGDDIYMAGFALSVPLFDRGQSARAEAEARARRLRLEHVAAERAATAEVRVAWDVYRERRRAADELARELPLLDDSESLAERSYDAGELSLAELLLVRRETLELRRAALEHTLAAAVAATELRAAAGVLP